MEPILTDLSPDTLVLALEHNLLSFIDALRRWPRAEVHDEPGITWSISDLPLPLFNSVYPASLPAGGCDEIIAAVVEAARQRGVPQSWWLLPSVQPADLRERLLAHGCSDQGQEPGMYAELQRLNEAVPRPPALVVERVESPAGFQQWGRTTAAVFDLPAALGEALAELVFCSDPAVNTAYLGWQYGWPVATSLLALEGGVAGIYNVATLPQARRQGIGAWMTLAPLLEARARGYRVGVLEASDMGLPVYRSLGFQECCRVGQCLWQPV